MSRRIALNQKLQREEGLEGMDTGDDNADGSDNDGDDPQEEDDEYDGMETDGFDRYGNDEYEEGDEEAAANEYEYHSEATTAEDSDHVAASRNGSYSSTDGKTDSTIRKGAISHN
jgi:hypothetical protein